MVKDEYLAANRRLLRVEVRVLLLEERRLVPQWFSATKITKVTKTTFPFVFLCVLCGYKNLFACGGVAGGDELLQAEAFKVLGEEAGELAPFRIVTRQENGLAAERVRVVVQIGVYLLLDVVVLRVELVVLRALRGGQCFILAHSPFTLYQ